VSEPDDAVDRRLAELGRATESIRARAAFSDRVMLRVLAEGAGWREELLRSARRLVPLAALAAVIALVWAVQSETSTDEALAVAEDQEEEILW
jgi:hypothetical protein